MHRKATVTYCLAGRREVPMIRLRGHWLARAGFAPGVGLALTVEQGRLIVELVAMATNGAEDSPASPSYPLAEVAEPRARLFEPASAPPTLGSEGRVPL